METFTGGRLVARMLRKEGVTTVFTLSGLHVAPIYAGCVDEGIRLIDTRHEQAAAHAADAWARLTRGVGVAVVTAGPGVTDAVTGVANAWAANVPLVLLGGAAPTFNQGRGSLQEMPQTQLFAGITKWSDRVPSPELVPSFLAKAFRVARAGRPGPVFLELPWDVLSNGADEALAEAQERYRTEARSPGDPAQLEEALKLLGGAERPVLLGGSSIWWDGAVEALSGLAERTGLPVYLNGMGRGCLPPDHPASSRARARRRWRRPTWCWWWAPRSTSAWATAPSPPSRPARGSSRWTSTRRRSGATGPSTWASWATPAACSPRSARAHASPAPPRAGGPSCGRRSASARSGSGPSRRATSAPSTTSGWRRRSTPWPRAPAT
ncbi:MAG: thiamine pyrophosphate-binding protein [Anaeromyxobacter sp.]